MLAIVQWIVLSSGWPRRLTALTAGAVGALALAPVDLLPAMIVPMTVAVWLIDGAARGEGRRAWHRLLRPRSLRAAAGVGWWWGLGYFIAGFWWLGAAFLVEPEKDAWALPFGVLGVPAVLALFPAFGFAFARLLWVPGAGRVIALVAGLGVSEWFRSWVLTGFPWNNYGMAFGDHLVLSQAASIVGNDGLTFLVVAIGAAPATLADPRRRPEDRLPRLAPTVLAVLATLGLYGFGTQRLPAEATATVPGVRLRIMQPNVPQDASFSYANKAKIVDAYLRLSDRATSPTTSGLGDVTHLIWPESAFPFILSQDPESLEAIGDALPAGTLLLTGAARKEGAADSSSTGAQEPRYFNAIEVVAHGGTILDSYDKVHLVPFGEYVPFSHVLSRLGIGNFVHIPGGFTAGFQHRLMDVPGLPPVAPAICYEAIFPADILPPGPASERERAGMILNVTNDGWFGRTAGPYQHFAQARLRAVEEGLPLVRAANTGISAVVDPYGRVTASLPLNVTNILDAALPQKIMATVYERYSALITIGLYTGTILTALGIALWRGNGGRP